MVYVRLTDEARQRGPVLVIVGGETIASVARKLGVNPDALRKHIQRVRVIGIGSVLKTGIRRVLEFPDPAAFRDLLEIIRGATVSLDVASYITTKKEVRARARYCFAGLFHY